MLCYTETVDCLRRTRLDASGSRYAHLDEGRGRGIESRRPGAVRTAATEFAPGYQQSSAQVVERYMLPGLLDEKPLGA